MSSFRPPDRTSTPTTTATSSTRHRTILKRIPTVSTSKSRPKAGHQLGSRPSTGVGDLEPEPSSSSSCSYKDEQAPARRSSPPRRSSPNSDDSDDDDDPDFGRMAQLQARAEADQLAQAEQIKQVKAWNKEEKKKAREQGRRPRVKDLPMSNLEASRKRKGKDKEKVTVGFVVDEEEASSEGEEEEEMMGRKAKATKPTFDPARKADEVQRSWNNRIAFRRQGQEGGLIERMEMTRDEAERLEHLKRRWAKKDRPEVMSEKRWRMEKKWNPLFVMLDIDPIIIAEHDEVEQDSSGDEDDYRDPDAEPDDPTERLERQIRAQLKNAMESDSDDGRSRKRGNTAVGAQGQRTSDGHHFAVSNAGTVVLSSDDDSEPATEDDQPLVSSVPKASLAAINSQSVEVEHRESAPLSEPETEVNTMSEPETEDDDVVMSPVKAEVRKEEDDDEDKEEVDALTRKFMEQQKQRAEAQKQRWLMNRLAVVASQTASSQPTSTSIDAPKVEAEDEDDEPAEPSLIESQRIAESRRLAGASQTQSYDSSEKRIIKGCRPRFEATPEQLEIGDHDLSLTHKIPAPINRFLRPYQREGIEFFHRQYSKHMGGILGDDMGLGKTIQVIGFLSAVMGKTGRRRLDEGARKAKINAWEGDQPPKPSDIGPTCLVVCPASVAENWYREITKWSYLRVGTLGSGKRRNEDVVTMFRAGYLDVLIGGYEHVLKNIETYHLLDISIIIADEVHRAKSRKTDTTRKLNDFPSTLRYGLTGTAVQNRISEFHSILDWACPGRVGTWQQWRDLVDTPIKYAQKSDADQDTLGRGRLRAIALVTKVLPHFFLRRTKHQPSVKLQLPKKTDNLVLCPLTTLQRKAYQNILNTDEVKRILAAHDPCPCGRTDPLSGLSYERTKCCDRGLRPSIFRFMHVLAKIANHLALLYPDQEDRFKNSEKYEVDRALIEAAFPNDWEGRRIGPGTALDETLCGKWNVLSELLEVWSDAGDKVLIFSNSLKVLKLLQDLFEYSKFPHLKLTGETKREDRMTLVDQFNDPNGGQFCFLISTKAGGVGLNLTSANKVVIFDPNFNPSHDLQAMDRSYRFGQTRQVQVYRLVGAGTIEELIINRQQMKRGLANIVYDGRAERRHYKGVEGSKEHEGELFGVKNLLALKSQSLTHEIVTAANEEDATFAPSRETEEGAGEAEEESKAVKVEEAAEPWQGADEVVEALLGPSGEASSSKVKTKDQQEIDRILSGLITLDADSALGPSKREEQRGAEAMAKQLGNRPQTVRKPKRPGPDDDEASPKEVKKIAKADKPGAYKPFDPLGRSKKLPKNGDAKR